MKILLIDSYDSFVYIIKNYIERLGHETHIVRNDKVKLETLHQYNLIILGPGPGHPLECGYLEIIKKVEGEIPILGVCLGLQAIGCYYGSKVVRAEKRLHGKTSLIKNDQKGCFKNLPSIYEVARYHSLIIEKIEPNQEIICSATSVNDNYIMGVRHKTHSIEGVQFHPESIKSNYGLQLIENFIENSKKGSL